jgi:hypothetical protein
MSATPTRPRLLSICGLVAGLVHLVAPRRLLGAARWGYDRVLSVDFQPRETSPRRVRLLGLAFVGASLLADRVARRRYLDSGDSR